MTTTRSVELRTIAQAIADALPRTVDEVVLTGSVSRGAADEVSDIEMLLVTRDELTLNDCFALATACGLTDLGTWGPQGVPTKRVSGYRDGVPIELIWWTREQAETAVNAIFEGDVSTTADALAHGVPLRTSGALARWQERLRNYPDELARARIEDAALTWGGFAAAGLLTLIRPGERLALVERMVDDASRVVRIVFAMNRVWQPTLKRLEERAALLTQKPDRLAQRIEEALTEPDPRRAVLLMTELQADTVGLAPDGPNINRARTWLRDARDILARAPSWDYCVGLEPSPENPLHGSCLCGGVQFEVTAPFRRANHCHCSRCRKHSGAFGGTQGRVPREGFRLLSGEELIRVFRPDEGRVKAFCSVCGSSLFGAEWPEGDEVGIRLGSLDGDPGIRPQFHTFVGSRAPWDEIPDDGLARYDEAHP